MSPNIQLRVENSFIESNQSSDELGITVYNRVFSKLINENKALGKVCPVYLKIGKTHKVLGILTLNISGSYSFFPEFTDGLQFDHMTFVKSPQGGHHYTRVTSEGRQKVLPIFAEQLTNGIYFVAAFIVGDINLLKDAPREVVYPLVNTDSAMQIQDAFFTAGEQEGSIIFALEEPKGSICIQLFLIPNDVDYKYMAIYPDICKKVQADFEIQDDTIINSSNLVIPHEYQNDYTLGVLAFTHSSLTNKSIIIATASNKAGFYSKLDVT